jgi:phage terminase large subunit-like protein
VFTLSGLADPVGTLPLSSYQALTRVPSVLRLTGAKLRPKPPGEKRERWLKTARAEQLPPDGDWWDVWFILAGRGWGKTRTGAEHVVNYARTHPGAQIAVIGRTDNEARRILLNGPSGIRAALEADDLAYKNGKPWIVETPGDVQVHFANGTVLYVAGASSPDALRGLNLDMAWCDELAAWRYQQMVWDEILNPAVRVGDHPHILVTTTPKPTKLIRTLLKDAATVVVRGSTYDNIKHLAPGFIRRMRAKYEGTRAGRQELHAEILDDVPGALVTRAQLDAGRVEGIPRGAVQDWFDVEPERGLRELVLALDPSDGTEDGDEAAMALVGLGWDHELYAVDTKGFREGTIPYLKYAVKWAQRVGATIVVEKNHGSQYLIDTLNQVMRDQDMIVPFRTVRATDGKRTRAEPVAVLFGDENTRPRLHMVGTQVEVEDQLTSWLGNPGEKSPDRLDALVWGASHFLRHELSDGQDDAGDDYAYESPTDPQSWANDGMDYAYG